MNRKPMRKLTFWVIFFLITWGQGANAAKEWYDYYQDGLQAMKNQRWREAIENFEKAIAENPQPKKRVVTPGNWILTDYYPYLQLGIAYLRLGQPEIAEKYLNKALAFEVEPKVEVYRYLAEVDEIKKRSLEKRYADLKEEKSNLERGLPLPETPTPVPIKVPTPTSVPTPVPTPTTLEVGLTPVQKPLPGVPPLPTPRPPEIAIPTPTPMILTGTLFIDSVPSEGTVLLNGQKKGETPLSLILKEGVYEVEIIKRGYPGYRTRVTVQPNQSNKYLYFLGEYDCDYDSSADRNSAKAINLEAFMKSDQIAEVDYDKGDCTDWYSVTIPREGKWTFEIQLLDNLKTNIEMGVYGPDSSTKLLGTGTRDSSHPEMIRFTPETFIPPSLYYLRVHARGKGDRALYKPLYELTEEVVGVETPVVAAVTPTPLPTATPLSTPTAQAVRKPKPNLKWPEISITIPYALLALASVAFCLAFVAIVMTLKSKSRHLPKPRPAFERVGKNSPTDVLSVPIGKPKLESLEEEEEILFLMKMDLPDK